MWSSQPLTIYHWDEHQNEDHTYTICNGNPPWFIGQIGRKGGKEESKEMKCDLTNNNYL